MISAVLETIGSGSYLQFILGCCGVVYHVRLGE